jgi:hypothetical protein
METHQGELDPLSMYYRICPYCKRPHMVKNRGRDFCSDRCADTYYNVHRRDLKQAEKIIAEKGMVTDVNSKQPIVIEESKIDYGENLNYRFTHNINLLNSLSIDLNKGTIYHIPDLVRMNFDFSIYEARNPLFNTGLENQCFYLTFKNFRMYLLEINKVLIFKTTEYELHRNQ